MFFFFFFFEKLILTTIFHVNIFWKLILAPCWPGRLKFKSKEKESLIYLKIFGSSRSKFKNDLINSLCRSTLLEDIIVLKCDTEQDKRRDIRWFVLWVKSHTGPMSDSDKKASGSFSFSNWMCIYFTRNLFY